MRAKAAGFSNSTLRLSALYLALFAISMLLVLAYIYYSTVHLLERQNEETITSDVTGLADDYRLNGVNGLVDAVGRRIVQNPDMLIMLADPSGKYIVGNLRSPPINNLPDNSWIDFKIASADQDAQPGHNARGFNAQLPQDYQLIVARDVNNISQFSDIIFRALFWSFGLSLLVGLTGAIWISRNFLRRIDGITQTSQTIMRGDLSGRMPISGTNDELDRLSLSLNEMLTQIEKLMQGIRDVSSNIAHDLKTPLNRLRVRIEAALRQNSKKEYEAALQQALGESEQLLATFNALLSIAQVDAGQQRNSLEVLDAHELLADVVELYGPVAEETNGTLMLSAERNLIMHGKRELMAQVLINLIDNALKYGRDVQGVAQIEVSGKRHGDKIVLAIADHGRGIAAKDRERVLDRFVRLDESRTKPGNGLGLSLVASVANLLNGKLILTDNGPGLRVELHVPAAVEKS